MSTPATCSSLWKATKRSRRSKPWIAAICNSRPTPRRRAEGAGGHVTGLSGFRRGAGIFRPGQAADASSCAACARPASNRARASASAAAARSTQTRGWAPPAYLHQPLRPPPGRRPGGELAKVKGSGRDGRIMARDIQAGQTANGRKGVCGAPTASAIYHCPAPAIHTPANDTGSPQHRRAHGTQRTYHRPGHADLRSGCDRAGCFTPPAQRKIRLAGSPAPPTMICWLRSPLRLCWNTRR